MRKKNLLAHHMDSCSLSCSAPMNLIRLSGKSRFPKWKFGLVMVVCVAAALIQGIQ